MSAMNRLKEFIVNYLIIQSVRTPDLNLLRELCKDTAPKHIIRIIRGCTRHNIRYELKDIPESLREGWKDDNRTCLHVAAEDGDFEMIEILFEKLSDEEKLQLLKLWATDDATSTVGWLCMWNGGVTWAMELAKSATHEDLKREIYEQVLTYTCQEDDAQALQLLFSAVTSDTLMSLLSTLTLSCYSCIQRAACRGISTFISMLSQHLPSDSVLPLLLEQCERDGGRTALHIACKGKNLKVIETVIDLVPIENRFALIIATDENGNTVLHAAVASRNKNLVHALKIDQLTGEQQYTLMVKENKAGLMAIHLAKQQNNREIEQYIDELLQESATRK
mgnify:CR=1 FL=1